LDPQLEKLIRELGDTINKVIEESPEIHHALERIRGTGSDVYLVLEATVAFKDKDKDADGEVPTPDFREIPIEQRLSEISAEDRQFLRSLNIKFDPDE
jgi:hypothetical protein